VTAGAATLRAMLTGAFAGSLGIAIALGTCRSRSGGFRADATGRGLVCRVCDVCTAGRISEGVTGS